LLVVAGCGLVAGAVALRVIALIVLRCARLGVVSLGIVALVVLVVLRLSVLAAVALIVLIALICGAAGLILRVSRIARLGDGLIAGGETARRRRQGAMPRSRLMDGRCGGRPRVAVNAMRKRHSRHRDSQGRSGHADHNWFSHPQPPIVGRRIPAARRNRREAGMRYPADRRARHKTPEAPV
jgi:hypothetical protein